MSISFISLVLVLVVAWNLVATIRVAKSSAYENTQKIFQYWLIWVLPIIGATLCYVLVNETTKAPATPVNSELENPAESIPGTDIWYGHSGHDSEGY